MELDAELCTRLHVLLLTPRLPVTNGLLRFDATCATYPVVLDPHHEEGVVLGELNRDFLQYKEKLDKFLGKLAPHLVVCFLVSLMPKIRADRRRVSSQMAVCCGKCGAQTIHLIVSNPAGSPNHLESIESRRRSSGCASW